jgi:nucleotide-binding universal stress UspA family protein
MINIKTILCPVDFFPASDAAVSYATGLAKNYDARLHLLHVITPVVRGAHQYAIRPSDMTKSLESVAAVEMTKFVNQVKAAGVAVDVETRVGDPYDEIKIAIASLKPELVVMGTHGRRGVERWFMGSTTEKLLRHSPVPLVTISASGERAIPQRFRRILVTTDFSDGTPDALSYAFSVAQENESRITLLHVLHEPTDTGLSFTYQDSLMKGVEKQLYELVPDEARNWCDIDVRVETGVPYRTILKTLQDADIDLLVMNIHGKDMLDRALVGSTAERVVRAACCPVMLIPPMRRKLKRKARPGGNRTAA